MCSGQGKFDHMTTHISRLTMNLMQESLRPIKDKLADAVSSCLDAALCEAGIMLSGHPPWKDE